MNIELYTKVHEVPIVQLPKGDKKFSDPWWQTLIRIDFNLNGMDHSIRPGFITNLGSVPKRLRHIVDTNDETLLAFVIHDYIYSKTVSGISRKDADRAMLEIAIMSGQDKIEAYIAWIGVRIGGWLAFKRGNASFKVIDRKLIAKICTDNDFFLSREEIEQLLNL